jgi:hypothetical protein
MTTRISTNKPMANQTIPVAPCQKSLSRKITLTQLRGIFNVNAAARDDGNPSTNEKILSELIGSIVREEIKPVEERVNDMEKRLRELELKLFSPPIELRSDNEISDRSDKCLVFVHSHEGDSIVPASMIPDLIKRTIEKNDSLLVDSLNREIYIGGEENAFIFTPLRFDLLGAFVRRLPASSSSRQLYQDAWREMGRGHVASALTAHAAVKRTMSRAMGELSYRLRDRMTYRNERWRIEPELKEFFFIREATNLEITECGKKGIPETNKRLLSSQ